MDSIEIVKVDFNTKKEFIVAMEMKREIEFDYNGVDYFKFCLGKGHYIYNSREKSYRYFEMSEELLEESTL